MASTNRKDEKLRQDDRKDRRVQQRLYVFEKALHGRVVNGQHIRYVQQGRRRQIKLKRRRDELEQESIHKTSPHTMAYISQRRDKKKRFSDDVNSSVNASTTNYYSIFIRHGVLACGSGMCVAMAR